MALLTARALRRKLKQEDLLTIRMDLREALREAHLQIDSMTAKTSTDDAQKEHHHQNSNKEVSEKDKEQTAQMKSQEEDTETATEDYEIKAIPLALVLQNCTEITHYAQNPIADWRGFLSTADIVRPMMGITDKIWQRGIQAMGYNQAAAVVAAMLERFTEFRSPSAYFSALIRKSEAGEFSCIRMIAALGYRTAAGSSQL